MASELQRRLNVRLLSLPILFLVAACAGDPTLTCEEAAILLAECDAESSEENCGNDSPAALRFASAECRDNEARADIFGNRGYGKVCTWDWQCSQDQGLTCRYGEIHHGRNYYSKEQRCHLPLPLGRDCIDHDDCEPGLYCPDQTSIGQLYCQRRE